MGASTWPRASAPWPRASSSPSLPAARATPLCSAARIRSARRLSDALTIVESATVIAWQLTIRSEPPTALRAARSPRVGPVREVAILRVGLLAGASYEVEKAHRHRPRRRAHGRGDPGAPAGRAPGWRQGSILGPRIDRPTFTKARLQSGSRSRCMRRRRRAESQPKLRAGQRLRAVVTVGHATRAAHDDARAHS